VSPTVTRSQVIKHRLLSK